MASEYEYDTAVEDLDEATTIGNTDLFLMEQAGKAKKITGKVFRAFLNNLIENYGIAAAFSEAVNEVF